MLFTVSEMELLCVLHQGTLANTLVTLEKAAPDMSAAKKSVAESALTKLRAMNAGESVALAFDEG